MARVPRDAPAFVFKCAYCGKKVQRWEYGEAGNWGYVYDKKRLCSYSCMRKMELADGNRRPSWQTLLDGLDKSRAASTKRYNERKKLARELGFGGMVKNG